MLYQRGQTWHIDIQHEGRRIRESTRTTDKKAAQRHHDQRRAELWATPVAGTTRTWLDACTDWLTAAERSASDKYSLRSLNANYPDRSLDTCTTESFIAALEGKAPATFNRYRAIVVAILTAADIKIKFPTRKVKKGRLRFLTRDEWARLHAELPDYLKPVAAFAVATGLRQRNITHLRWSEVDLKRSAMWIHPDQAKGGKAIGIPLSSEAAALLTAQEGKHDDWVFPYKGRGRTEGGPVVKIKTAWQLAMERAGLGHFTRWEDATGKKHKKWHGDFTFHGLRHTWASWHVMSGTPLEVLQKLGAWEDPRMVQNYAHLAPEFLASFANNAKPWQPKKKQAAKAA